MSVEDFIDNLISIRDSYDIEFPKSVKFSIALDSLQNKRLEKVCEELGQKRASFSSDAIMKVVEVAENKLGLQNEKYIFELLDQLKQEEGVAQEDE